MKLSKSAIEDLRINLRKTYGADFDTSLSDEQVDNIGNIILTAIIESLKLNTLDRIN
jgi:hypothetical protein